MFNKVVCFFLVILSVSVGGGANAASASRPGPTTSGYLDVQHQMNRGALDVTDATTLSGESTGFVVNQGAVVFSDEWNRAELLIDVPFRQSTTTGKQTNDLELGTKQAQAYMKYQFDSGLFGQIGQFDTSFGLESNDTVDLFFPRHGILHGFTPNTHTGIQVGIASLPYFAQFLVANANSVGLQTDNQSPDLGLRVGFSQEPLQVGIGILYNKTRGEYALINSGRWDYKPRILLNGVVQAHVGRVELGAEVDVSQSRLQQADTPDGTKRHDLILGYLAQGIFNLTDTWGLGVRYEYLRNDETNEYVQATQDAVGAGTNTLTGQGGYLSKATIGVRKVLHEDLTAKAGVEWLSLNVGRDLPDEGKSVSWAQAALGVIYDF